MKNGGMKNVNVYWFRVGSTIASSKWCMRWCSRVYVYMHVHAYAYFFYVLNVPLVSCDSAYIIYIYIYMQAIRIQNIVVHVCIEYF
jgi:hypothetical protein